MSPTMGPNSIRIYRTEGQYVFALTATPGPNDRLSAGTTQFDIAPSATNDIQASDFDPRLLDTSSARPTGSTGTTADIGKLHPL